MAKSMAKMYIFYFFYKIILNSLLLSLFKFFSKTFLSTTISKSSSHGIIPLCLSKPNNFPKK